jgi:hypothetical protein
MSEALTKEELVNKLRRCANAVYLATEQPVAADISRHLIYAADRIASLESQLAAAQLDAGRLNWLEKTDIEVFQSPGRRPLFTHYFAVHNLRDAIDAAITGEARE